MLSDDGENNSMVGDLESTDQLVSEKVCEFPTMSTNVVMTVTLFVSIPFGIGKSQMK